MTPNHINNPNYQPSPQPIRTYSGPAIPAAYDTNWQHFNNLTPHQVGWFQAQPEWKNFVAWVALNPAKATIHAYAPAQSVIDADLQAAGKAVAT